MGHTLWWTNIAIEHGPFIDGLPIKNGDFPLLFVCSPEGRTPKVWCLEGAFLVFGYHRFAEGPCWVRTWQRKSHKNELMWMYWIGLYWFCMRDCRIRFPWSQRSRSNWLVTSWGVPPRLRKHCMNGVIHDKGRTPLLSEGNPTVLNWTPTFSATFHLFGDL